MTENQGVVTDATESNERGLIGIPGTGSPLKVPGKLISVTTSSEGLIAVVAVEGGRIVVPYWAIDFSPVATA